MRGSTRAIRPMRKRRSPARIELRPTFDSRAERWGRWARLRCVCLALALASPLMAAVTEEEVASDVGTLHLIRPADPPKGLLIYITGTRGWDTLTTDTARALAEEDYLIAGVEPAGLRSAAASAACWDVGADVARIAHWVGDRAALPPGALPVVLGEAEGASLAYAALLQSPPNSFHAVLSLDFCPLSPVDTPLCSDATPTSSVLRDARLQPAPRVESTWFVLATDRGPPCNADQTAAFVARVDNARLISAGVGSTPSTPGRDWQAQLTALLRWLDPRIPNQVGTPAAAEDLAGLSLTEVRAQKEDLATFAVMLSGDGGWAALDRGVSAELADHGISTVGWDSLGYFWKARSADEAGKDLARVLSHYMDAWDKGRVILIGYSFGADVLSFLANRLPPDLRASVILVTLLGAGPAATFEFHLGDWLSDTPTGDVLPVLPELKRLNWTRLLCISGEEEDDSICPELSGPGIKVLKLPGDHHFDEDYAGVADLILKELNDGAAVH